MPSWLGRLRFGLRILQFKDLLRKEPWQIAKGPGLIWNPGLPLLILNFACLKQIRDEALKLILAQHAAPLKHFNDAQNEGPCLKRVELSGLQSGPCPGMDYQGSVCSRYASRRNRTFSGFDRI